MVVQNISFIVLLLTMIMARPFQESTESAKQTCSDCHSSITDGEIIHKAMKAGCDLCHESTGEPHPSDGIKGFKLAEEMPDLCYLCHDDYREMKYFHKPVKDCMICHTPHNSDKNKLLTYEITELCILCHEDISDLAANSLVKHRPVYEGGNCIDCHSPHSSTERRLLVEEDSKLCLSCHNTDFTTDSSSIENISKLLKTNKVKHSALKGGCSSCHLPHGADYSALLADAYPRENYAAATYENFSLCFFCHDSDLLEAETTSIATNFRNGDQNLHFLHIKGDKGRSCHLCHNVHAASNEYIIAESIPFGTWVMQMNFTSNENGGSCMPGCHSEQDYSRVITDINE